MSDADLSERIREQFSYGSERADIWYAFAAVIATDRFLNLGYSRWYQSHLVGSPQRRLVARAVGELQKEQTTLPNQLLLDIGCGRGGPAVYLANEYRFSVVGVDLVPYNVSVARRNARRDGSNTAPVPTFVVGDATQLPFESDTFPAVSALDSIVYMPDKRGVFEEIRRVLRPDGVCVVTDLVVEGEAKACLQDVRRFADAWDMPPVRTAEQYREAIRESGLKITAETDLTAHSVGRFRKWTSLYLLLADSPFETVLSSVLEQCGVNSDVVTAQIHAAHGVLPALRHRLYSVVKRDQGTSGSRYHN